MKIVIATVGILWIVLFWFEDIEIALIYLSYSVYYVSFGILSFIYYLKFLEYTNSHETYEPNLVFEYLLEQTKVFTPVMLVWIIISGYYSYKLDYDYMQNIDTLKSSASYE